MQARGIRGVARGDRREAVATLACFVAWSLTPIGHAQSARKTPPQGGSSREPATKVTVVVAGDPTKDLRAAATRVDEALQSAPGLRTPTEPRMRAALRGEPADGADDGLAAARTARRKLGWSEARDLPALAAIGRRTGAVAIVEVRRRHGHIEAVVADVGARAFYEGTIDVSGARDAELVAFVRTRAEAAAQRIVAGGTRKASQRAGGPVARRAAEGTQDTGPPRASGSKPSGSKTGTSDAQSETAEQNAEQSAFVAWLADNWAYLAAGVALAGVTTFFIVRGQNGDDPPQPVLRFTSGGGS